MTKFLSACISINVLKSKTQFASVKFHKSPTALVSVSIVSECNGSNYKRMKSKFYKLTQYKRDP